MFSRISLAAAAIGLLAPSLASSIEAKSNSLSIAPGKPLLTFDYSTENADSGNWIGVFCDCLDTLGNDTFLERSSASDFAPRNKGVVEISTSTLKPGLYHAYLLSKNENSKLAGPVEVVIPSRGDTPLMKLAPQQEGGESAEIGTNVKRSIVNQSDANIPMHTARSRMVDELVVLSFNTWGAGENINDGFRKQVEYLLNAGVDIVGLQETLGRHATELGEALGWFAWQGPDVGIISRYPIVEVFPATSVAGGVRVALGDNKEVIVWNAHLGPFPYGPYDFCYASMNADQVLQGEAEAGRTQQIVEIMDRMKRQIANAFDVPVILMGDFNAPSQLDWTETTRGHHCNVGPAQWPTSNEPLEAGMLDSFREVHPDPLAEPGDTWSPIFLDNNGRPEPKDRIDFIYHRGLETIYSQTEVIGQPIAEPYHVNNEWASDHAALKTIFRVAPRNFRRTPQT